MPSTSRYHDIILFFPFPCPVLQQVLTASLLKYTALVFILSILTLTNLIQTTIISYTQPQEPTWSPDSLSRCFTSHSQNTQREFFSKKNQTMSFSLNPRRLPYLNTHTPYHSLQAPHKWVLFPLQDVSATPTSPLPKLKPHCLPFLKNTKLSPALVRALAPTVPSAWYALCPDLYTAGFFLLLMSQLRKTFFDHPIHHPILCSLEHIAHQIVPCLSTCVFCLPPLVCKVHESKGHVYLGHHCTPC